MNNDHHYDDFDEFVQNCGEATAEPKTMAQLIEQRGRIPSAAELCEARLGAFRREPARDPFEVLMTAEEGVAQLRIAQAIRQPADFKKMSSPPTFSSEAKPELGDLSYLVGLDQVEVEGDPPLPTITSRVPDSARVGDHILAKGHGGGLLSRPFDNIMELVGKRAGGGAAALARSLAREWRETEGAR